MCFSYFNSEKHLTFTNIPFALALSVKKIVYQLLKFQTFFKFKAFLNISASICQVLFNNLSFCLFCFLFHLCYTPEFFFKLPCTQMFSCKFCFYKSFSFVNETPLCHCPNNEPE